MLDITDLANLIRRRLAGRSRRSIDDRSLRRAAVLMPLFEDRGEPQVLFTRRTETLEHHKGQISFPGGATDASDTSPVATALRETEEELGIPGDRIEILGLLDDLQATVSGFLITPSVGIIPHPVPLRISRAEIADVLTVPLRVFRDPSALRVEQRERGGKRAEVFVYTYGPHEIWGVTARIMKNLVDAVFGADRQ